MVTKGQTDRYRAPVASMDLIGGALCLDLVNTASERERPPQKERLWEYDDLVEWGLLTESMDEATAGRLRNAAAADPAGAARVLEHARAIRDAMYRVFSERSVDGADLELLGRAGAEAAAARRLVRRDEGFALEWPPDSDLARAWWPAAASALELLLSDDLGRVKECATDNCSWLFLDMSRNRSRRWCDMKDCGNRAKARRHYARRRQS